MTTFKIALFAFACIGYVFTFHKLTMGVIYLIRKIKERRANKNRIKYESMSPWDLSNNEITITCNPDGTTGYFITASMGDFKFKNYEKCAKLKKEAKERGIEL